MGEGWHEEVPKGGPPTGTHVSQRNSEPRTSHNLGKLYQRLLLLWSSFTFNFRRKSAPFYFRKLHEAFVYFLNFYQLIHMSYKTMTVTNLSVILDFGSSGPTYGLPL